MNRKSSAHNSLYCVVQNDLAGLATVIMASRCAMSAPNAASRHCGPCSDTAPTKTYSSMPYNDFYSIREFHVESLSDSTNLDLSCGKRSSLTDGVFEAANESI
jgi:hypothetical protein